MQLNRHRLGRLWLRVSVARKSLVKGIRKLLVYRQDARVKLVVVVRACDNSEAAPTTTTTVATKAKSLISIYTDAPAQMNTAS